MNLKSIVLSSSILILSFLLLLNLRPQNSLENLHANMEVRYDILLSEDALDEGEVVIPADFDEHWNSLESIIKEHNYSFSKHRGKTLTRKTYYVLDSPYQRSMLHPNVNLHINVYIENQKIVAAYLFKESEPDILFPLDYIENR